MLNSDPDYALLDKILKRLKFFQIFEPRVRSKFLRLAHYRLATPNKVIYRKEKQEYRIVVIVSGTASVVCKDRTNGILYVIRTLFPGDSVGDMDLS